MNGPFSILTTYPLRELEEGGVLPRHAHLSFLNRGTPRSLISLVRLAFHGMMGKRYHAVLVEGAREALFLSFVKLLTRNRTTRLICNLTYLPNPAKRLLQKLFQDLKLGILRRGTDLFIVLSTDEVESYSRALHIPRHKLCFIPYKMHSQSYLASLAPTDGDYIWAAGDSVRDYETLFEAVRPLGIPVRVLTNLRFPPDAVPPGVSIIRNSNTPADYFGPCAGCRLAVIPIKKNIIRTCGQATYLGAMFLKKPVIVSDTPGSRDLIRDGSTGFIVPPGDPISLREKIVMLVNDPALRARIGEQAHHEVGDQYTLPRFLDDLFTVIERCLQNEEPWKFRSSATRPDKE